MEGLTSALLDHVRPGVVIEVGRYLVVGSEDSEVAVAQVTSVEPNGIVHVRVLPGPATEHLHHLSATSGA
jgi:hypothetical protein